MNLLDFFVLAGVHVVKIGGELFRPIPNLEQCQARVELNMTPQPPDGPGAFPGGFVVAVRYGVLGTPPFGRDDERYFGLEVIVNAAYRQELGEPISFAAFQEHHTSLTRQLFPLLYSYAQRALGELGLCQIRLPLDIFPRPQEVPTSVH